MSENKNYKSFEIMTSSLILSKPVLDKKGNQWIVLKVDNLIHPYGTITINKKYITLQYNKDYAFINIFLNQIFVYKDKDGRAKGTIDYNKLAIYLSQMDNKVKLIKAERKQISNENKQFYAKHNSFKNDIS
ncbi:hypothetical protein [Spiroplasma endosymbiont of Glossina fuscipes fuscipes]|uniref:hypothetical protein n=1 Tax=Spiroplasma endosymbiont of Glossina fuscipes fuscipes TaxID=2004463 RepID=UPI003C720806